MIFNIIWLTPDRFDLKPDKSSWVEMANAFIDMGHSVTILTSKSKNKISLDENEGLITYLKALDIPFIFRFSVLLKMLFWLRRHASPKDVIIINQDALLLVPFIKIWGLKNTYLDIRTLPVDMHSIKDYLDKFLYWYIPLKLFARRVRGYSFITERLKNEIEKDFNLKINNYVIWQSGVSTDIFYPKIKNNKKTERFRLFYHGTISVNRGIGLVIEALTMIDKEIDIEFVIVGDGADLEKLKKLSNDLSLNDRVIFRGFMPYEKMVDEIALADICICPLTNRLEWNVSSPIKLFEYMACGKPMILTPISAHKDVASQLPFVVWTNGFKPEDFQKAILEAIEQNDKLADYAKAAPEFVKTNFEWRCQAKKLENYLSKRMHEPAI